MDRQPARWPTLVVRWALVPLVVGGVTLASSVAGANETTASLLLLMAVLGLATWGGWALGAAASLVATFCLSLFFLPPADTLTFEEACFLAAATLVSHLVARARQEAAEALSRQRELEVLYRERVHLEAVRESEALKTALLRAVSHDLRTPLTSIRLEIESLERRFASRPEELASLRGLSVQQERLTRRIDNLLAMARLEAGVARPQPEPTPAGSLFRAAREHLALVLAERPVEVAVEPGCPDVWTDPSMSLEVLVNLLENAARAAPPDQPLELAAQSLDGHVRLEVRDRGPGLPVRAAGEVLSEGLGLRIARSLAAADGGSIELLDRPGGGTIARLDLPRAPEPEEIPEIRTA
jgi:two-component system sensor histidine kinase KdpD